MSTKSKISILSRLRSFPAYMGDPSISKIKKGVVVIMVAYLLSPVDLLPELFMTFIGLLDDLGVLALLTTWMYSELGSYVRTLPDHPQEPNEQIP